MASDVVGMMYHHNNSYSVQIILVSRGTPAAVVQRRIVPNSLATSQVALWDAISRCVAVDNSRSMAMPHSSDFKLAGGSVAFCPTLEAARVPAKTVRLIQMLHISWRNWKHENCDWQCFDGTRPYLRNAYEQSFNLLYLTPNVNSWTSIPNF